MLSEMDIHRKFMSFWKEKGELLVYKSFVSTYPDCALWYDQITGSIPPAAEVEISCMEMPDDGFSECHFDQAGSSLVNNSLKTNEILKQTLCFDDSCGGNSSMSDHHASVTGDRSLDTIPKIVTAGCRFGAESISGSRKSDLSSYCDVSQECEHSDCDSHTSTELNRPIQAETLHAYVVCKNEQYVCNHNSPKVTSSNVDKKHMLEESRCFRNVCTSNIHLTDLSEKHSNANEEQFICDHSQKDCNSCTKVDVAEGAVLECGITKKINVSTSSGFGDNTSRFMKARDLLYAVKETPLSVSSADSAVSSSESSDTGKSHNFSILKQETLLDCRILEQNSCNSVLQMEQLLPQGDHCYTSSYVPYHKVKWQNGLDDDDDFHDDHSDKECVTGACTHEDLIAVLKELHEDLMSQIYRHVQERVSEWLRKNPDKEFDESSFDEDLIGDVYPSMELEVACINGMNEFL